MEFVPQSFLFVHDLRLNQHQTNHMIGLESTFGSPTIFKMNGSLDQYIWCSLGLLGSNQTVKCRISHQVGGSTSSDQNLLNLVICTLLQKKKKHLPRNIADSAELKHKIVTHIIRELHRVNTRHTSTKTLIP